MLCVNLPPSKYSIFCSTTLTIIKTNGSAMRMLAMAKEPTLALTKKAKLTADRLTMLMVKQYRKNASTSGFRPELIKKGRLGSCVSF